MARKNQWPTPTAQDFKRRGPSSKQQGLSNAVMWPTPKASDWKRNNVIECFHENDLVAGHEINMCNKDLLNLLRGEK